MKKGTKYLEVENGKIIGHRAKKSTLSQKYKSLQISGIYKVEAKLIKAKEINLRPVEGKLAYPKILVDKRLMTIKGKKVDMVTLSDLEKEAQEAPAELLKKDIVTVAASYEPKLKIVKK